MALVVLVADDDDDVRSLIMLQLQLSGFEPMEAATVDEAVRILADQSPDIVLTDLNFGTDTGERIVIACREAQLPVILMTASVDTRDLPEGLRQGLSLLRKPFTLDDLLAAITELETS
jgi:two-component system, OmpR family, phosphate regulon response regulator PhoB